MMDLRKVDEMPLEELCTPLSAKVLPRSAYFSNDGVEKDEKHVKVTLSKSRQTRAKKKPFANKVKRE